MLPSFMSAAPPHPGAEVELALLRTTVVQMEKRLDLMERMLTSIMRQHDAMLAKQQAAGDQAGDSSRRGRAGRHDVKAGNDSDADDAEEEAAPGRERVIGCVKLRDGAGRVRVDCGALGGGSGSARAAAV